jgi:hypothetical protein
MVVSSRIIFSKYEITDFLFSEWIQEQILSLYETAGDMRQASGFGLINNPPLAHHKIFPAKFA